MIIELHKFPGSEVDTVCLCERFYALVKSKFGGGVPIRRRTQCVPVSIMAASDRQVRLFCMERNLPCRQSLRQLLGSVEI